eukprot:TRINITY_DN8859_c0_g1_i1.p1 TRINITY_DN8859_c0_g1~~TRINITY_DN8859_c0_g1_i1.p1  ORF type:complete len:111 (-),score=13.29 TRINITY_DN8859_c0_g1_i1:87-419(-)
MPATAMVPTEPAVLAIQSLFAIVTVVGTVGLLIDAWFSGQSDDTGFMDDGYSWCGLLRDLRSLASFTLGVAGCLFFLTGEYGDGDDGLPGDTARNVCTSFTPLAVLLFAW